MGLGSVMLGRGSYWPQFEAWPDIALPLYTHLRIAVVFSNNACISPNSTEAESSMHVSVAVA